MLTREHTGTAPPHLAELLSLLCGVALAKAPWFIPHLTPTRYPVTSHTLDTLSVRWFGTFLETACLKQGALHSILGVGKEFPFTLSTCKTTVGGGDEPSVSILQRFHPFLTGNMAAAVSDPRVVLTQWSNGISTSLRVRSSLDKPLFPFTLQQSLPRGRKLFTTIATLKSSHCEPDSVLPP